MQIIRSLITCPASAALLTFSMLVSARAEIVIRIGTTNLTTNTVNTGVVIKQLGLLEKFLPRTGRYANEQFRIEWSNYTTGPQETNAMLAGRLDFAVMGDYPLVINAITLKGTANESRLIATAGFNLQGGGNGIVVHRNSGIKIVGDLVGKTVSVPFGSAAHGMLLKGLRDNGVGQDQVMIVNQGVEVGATNLQERKVDAVAGFVPFPDLLTFRGFARKVYDGALSALPTWHGVVVRSAFADAYPEVVTAYVRAIVEANNWIRREPVEAATRIAQWTGVEREVVYLILGPGGIMTLDPTLRPQLLESLNVARQVLTAVTTVGDFDVQSWADDRYVRRAFAEAGGVYGSEFNSQTLGSSTIQTTTCAHKSVDVRLAVQVWTSDGLVEAFSDLRCLAVGLQRLREQSRTIAAAYVLDRESQSQAFGQFAYFVVPRDRNAADIIAFSRREAAEIAAVQLDGIAVDFAHLTSALEGEGSR
jgi:sulfonate transport system substrate-binding protein